MAEININNLSPLTGNMVASDGNVYNIVDILLEGGGSAVIEELNVTPTTSAQVITVPSGTDGYNPVNISAVTSSIDANIQAENIKDGIEILGVTGKYPRGALLINIIDGDVNGHSYFDVKDYSQCVISSNTLLGLPLKSYVYISGNTIMMDYDAYNIDASYITTIYQNGLQYKFAYCKIKSVDFSNTTNANSQAFEGAFYGADNTSESAPVFDFSSLSNVTYQTAVFKRAFYNAKLSTNTIFKFDSLVTPYNSLFEEAFARDQNDITSNNYFPTSISFDALNNINKNNMFYKAFAYRNGLQSISFPAVLSTNVPGTYQSPMGDMLLGVTGCTVHFPSNLQSVFENHPDVTNGFGGTNTTVLFDLPATAS